MTPQDPATASFFLHYPRLVTDGSVEVLNGTLRTLDFETFLTLEDDWARESYFKRTRPVFWIRTGEEVGRLHTTASDDDPFAATRDDAMLIYNGLLAVTGELYPDPRLSMEYVLSGTGAWSRRVGSFERTWLLNGGGLEPTPQEVLDSVAALAKDWHSYGFRHDDVVFSPLRGLASVASTFMEMALGMLPLIVSLEGFLLYKKVDGIAQHMAQAIKHLLGDAVPVDIEDFMRGVYKVRSELIHDAEIPSEDIAAICGALRQLTGSVVIAAAEQMMQRQIPSEKFDELRQEWLS
jgi:hypothetical protein